MCVFLYCIPSSGRDDGGGGTANKQNKKKIKPSVLLPSISSVKLSVSVLSMLLYPHPLLQSSFMINIYFITLTTLIITFSTCLLLLYPEDIFNVLYVFKCSEERYFDVIYFVI